MLKKYFGRTYYGIILLISIQCSMVIHAVVPGVPSNIQANVDRGYIHIKWDPPTVNLEAVDYYEIHFKPKGHEDRFIRVDKSVTEASIAGVLCETTYTIFVRAFSANHEGSKTIVQIVSTGGIKPSPPRNVKGEVVGNVDINVVWAEPEQNPGAVTEYRVYYKSLNPENMTIHAIGVEFSNHTSYITDLMEYTTYEICVTSKNQNYESNTSNVVRVKTSSETKTTVSITMTTEYISTDTTEENEQTTTTTSPPVTQTVRKSTTSPLKKPVTVKKDIVGVNSSSSLSTGHRQWLLFSVIAVFIIYGMPETCSWG